MDSPPKETLIPDTVYEIIAYFCSTSVFLVLVSVGLVDTSALSRLKDFIHAADRLDITMILFGFVTLSYSYGQLASTLSALFIAIPVARVVKRLGARASSDFHYDFSQTVRQYDLADRLPVSKVNNKWTLIFFLLSVSPNIGRDLLKRYAREKLARINAFNSALLAFMCLASWILRRLSPGITLALGPYLRVGSAWLLLGSSALTVLFCYEYYQRKCWNNDLLIKVLPAVASGVALSAISKAGSQEPIP